MRTTLDIEDDVYLYAREIAAAERISVGKVVSRIMRDGLRNSTAAAASTGAYVYRNGIPIIPPSNRVVTQALIDKIRDDEGI